jgi:hypothetical protein
VEFPAISGDRLTLNRKSIECGRQIPVWLVSHAGGLVFALSRDRSEQIVGTFAIRTHRWVLNLRKSLHSAPPFSG